MIVSVVNSNDVVARLSLGTIRDLRNAAKSLCEAEEGKSQYGAKGNGYGYSAVTKRAKQFKESKRGGSKEDMDWLIAERQTLEANMHGPDMFPPGRILWAMRDSDLHPSHRSQNPDDTQAQGSAKKGKGKDKLRLFEVLDVENVFDQIVFAKNMLRCVGFLFSLWSNGTNSLSLQRTSAAPI